MFKKLCGTENFANIVLGITWWDEEDEDVAMAREKVLKSTPELWGDMIAKGSRVQRVPLQSEGCEKLLLGLAGRKATTLRIQREMLQENKTAAETDAASELDHQGKLCAIEATKEDRQRKALRKFEEQAVSKAAEQKLPFEKIRGEREVEQRVLKEQQQQLENEIDQTPGAKKLMRRSVAHAASLQTQARRLEEI